MNWAEIKLIVDFNMTDTLRSQAFWFLSIIFAVMFGSTCADKPLDDQTARHPCRLGLIGNMPEFKKLFNSSLFTLVELKEKDPQLCIKRNEADVVIQIPAELDVLTPHNVALLESSPPTINVCYDAGKSYVETAASKTADALIEHREEILNQWLQAAQLKERWHLRWSREQKTPAVFLARIDPVKAPSKRLKAVQELTMAIFTTIGLVGGIFTCGVIRDEQQKKTLVLLLISPNSQSSIIVGIFLFSLVATCGISLGALTLSMYYVGVVAPTSWAPWFTVLCLFLASVPMAIFATACGALSSTYVHTDTKAYVALILTATFCSLLSAAVYLNDPLLSSFIWCVPVSGCSVNIKNMLFGSLDISSLLLSSCVTTLCGLLILVWSAHRFNRGVLLDRALPETAQRVRQTDIV